MKNELINEMFEKKMNLIYKYLVKLGCSQDNAEDIVQDTFYKALKYIYGIQADKISAWLFKVAINKYYDLCRKSNRHIHLNIDEKIFEESLTESKLVEEFILDLERKEEILEILNSISDITLNWYWVDTFNENGKELSRKSAFYEYDVYGIKALDKEGNIIDSPEKDFINAINKGKENNYDNQYKKLFDNLSNGKGKINKEDLKIIGAVVSGDSKTLKALKDKTYIKAATLGAVADKY